MGDHRFTITIKMEFHGVEEEWGPAWLNWSGGRDGIDRRVTEFIESVRDRGYARFDDAMFKAEEARNKESIERTEREQLARLKAKYEP